MKSGSVLRSLSFSLASWWTHAAYLQQTPIEKVTALLVDMKSRIESDGTAEQATYDKYACWCEDTLVQKAADISTGKESIEALQQLLIKLGGEIGSHSAEIKQLEKEVAQN